jgi:hypothetical protein
VCVCVAICSVGSCVKTEFPNREIFIIFPYEGYISFFRVREMVLLLESHFIYLYNEAGLSEDRVIIRKDDYRVKEVSTGST